MITRKQLGDIPEGHSIKVGLALALGYEVTMDKEVILKNGIKKMTQTITKANTIPTGKIYPVEHLRTAESIEQLCDYVDAGHPIATVDGAAANVLRFLGGYYHYDYFDTRNIWFTGILAPHLLLDGLKLAPLAYKDGRPLRVGDRIGVPGSDATFPIDIGWILTMVEEGFDWHIV